MARRSGHYWVVVRAGEVIGEQFGGGVLVFDFAFFLFEGDGLVLVLEDVAVGAAAALEGVVALAEGAIGGDVLEGLGDGRHRWERFWARSLRMDSARWTWPARARARPSLKAASRSGRVFEDDLEREHGGFGKVDGQGGIGEEPMRGEAMGIAVQDLFGGDEGIARVGAEFVLALGEGGEWLAAPNIFLRNPPCLPARLNWAARRASRHL
jgi:hypothetical protein